METVKVPKYHFKQRIQQQYNNVPLAILRELIQNSRDAGAKNMWFEFEDGKFVCRDDGHSMTEVEFREYYLNLGGTYKRTDSIGGFGAAKELTFAADKWAAIGKDFICNGEGCHYSISAFPPQNGFVLTASDPSYNKRDFQYVLRHICRKSVLPLSIWLNNEEVSQGRKLHSNQMLWDFGFARLYSPRKADFHGECVGYKVIRTKGLMTREEYIGGDYIVYLEIDDPLKILTENREGIREEYAKKLNEEIQALIKRGLERKAEVKQITLYGIPKQRSYAPQASSSNGHGLAYNVAGDIVSAYQKVDYESEVGQWPTAPGGPEDAPTTEEPIDENPIVTELDAEALQSIETAQTAMGMMKFAHKQLQHWQYPFAIVEAGQKAVQTFREGTLTEKAKKALTIALTLNKMICSELHIKVPIPALLFSNSENGIHTTAGPYELVGYDPDILTGEKTFEGSPFAVLELVIHEITHHYHSDHSQTYETKRMEIARQIGPKIEAYLMIIKGLQNA